MGYVQDATGKSQTCNLALPRSKAAADLQGQGFVAAAYATKRVVNVVSEANDDPRFHPTADAGCDGAAKTALCVPLTQRGKTQVRLVLQALDVKEPKQCFNAESDAHVMRLLGRVSMEMMKVCEATAMKLANSRRKDTLVQLFTELVPINTPLDLLRFHETGLSRLFRSTTASLYLIVLKDTE